MATDFDRPTPLDLVMYPVVTFEGYLYYDWNENGKYDPPADPDDPNDVGEGVHIPRFTLQGVKDHEVYPFVNGSFKTTVAPYDNYTLFIQYRQMNQTDQTEYEWFKNITIDLTTDTYMDISLDRRLEIHGEVFWDISGDGIPAPDEGVTDAVVELVGMDIPQSYQVTTAEVGQFIKWVQVGVSGNATYNITVNRSGFEPVEPYLTHVLEAHNQSVQFEMTALMVTFNGTTFLDLNLNGKMNSYESPVQVDSLELWSVQNTSIHYTASSDANGSFTFTVEPGLYNIYAWTDMNGSFLVNLGLQDVDPESEVQEVFLPMVTGRRTSGIMYYYNYTEQNHTVEDVNLTFVQMDGFGRIPIMQATGGVFAVVLPEGRYDVNGSFENPEFGVDMTYELEEDFRMVLSDLPDAEYNFTRVSEHKLDIWWDDEPINIDVNSTINLTIYVKNTGSENGTFDLFAEVQPEWSYDLEVDNVTLNLSETTHFFVHINSSARAIAGPNEVTLQAFPRDSTDDPSELVINVNINQFYGFDIRESVDQQGNYRWEKTNDGGTRRLTTYFFTVENEGNGKETLKFTHSGIPDWNITLHPDTIDLDAYEESSVPIEVILPDRDELNPQVLVITATSLNDPSQDPQVLELELSFPQFTVLPGDMGGETMDGEAITSPPNEAPGVGLLGALAALAIVGVAARRRRRRC